MSRAGRGHRLAVALIGVLGWPLALSGNAQDQFKSLLTRLVRVPKAEIDAEQSREEWNDDSEARAPARPHRSVPRADHALAFNALKDARSRVERNPWSHSVELSYRLHLL